MMISTLVTSLKSMRTVNNNSDFPTYYPVGNKLEIGKIAKVMKGFQYAKYRYFCSHKISDSERTQKKE